MKYNCMFFYTSNCFCHGFLCFPIDIYWFLWENHIIFIEICGFLQILYIIFQAVRLGTGIAGIIVLNNVIIEKSSIFPLPVAAGCVVGTAAVFAEARTEMVRKSLHFLIALSPGMAAINYPLTVLALMAGVLGYTFMEILRLSGVKIPVVSTLTAMASRPKDIGVFVLGPVTLGIGALLALLLFPSPAACIGIYALAFGDGFAGLIGKLFGRIRPAFLFGKSVEGSAACFAATFISAWLVSHNYAVSIAAAITAMAVEALPLEDYDNISLPLIVGVVVRQIY
jgi:dolichol kinase